MNLNLFMLLTTLAQTGSAEACAKKLGISRSKVSRDLAELRRHFDNELFSFQEGNCRPNRFTQELLAQIQPSLDNLKLASQFHGQFDVAHFDGELTIYADPHLEEMFALALNHRMRELDYPLRLKFCHAREEDMAQVQPEQLVMKLTYFPQPVGRHLVQKRLGTHGWWVVCRASHPLAQFEQLQMEQLMGQDLLMHTGGWQSVIRAQTLAQTQALYDSSRSPLQISSLSVGLRCVRMLDQVMFTGGQRDAEIGADLAVIPLYIGERPAWVDFGMIYHRSWEHHSVMTFMERTLRQIRLRLRPLPQ